MEFISDLGTYLGINNIIVDLPNFNPKKEFRSNGFYDRQKKVRVMTIIMITIFITRTSRK